jgi:hypothetical protein
MLNDNQKRKISATIRFLKVDLSTLEKLFTGNNDIPSSKRKDLIDLVSLVKERSDALSETFGFQERKEAASREALGILSALWVDLKEIKADKLRSYGKVSSEEESDFDPEIDRIMDLISEMQRVLRRRS